jgi:2-hydroxychromene-2-carboxylate isomerase
METENRNFDADVFWSMRSPYCYMALDRCLKLQRKYHLNLHFNPVWPIAIDIETCPECGGTQLSDDDSNQRGWKA